MASRSVTVVLKNATDEMLLTSTSSLSWGDWDVAPTFPFILSGGVEAFTSQSDGAGTQGVLNLILASDPTAIFTITWDNPYLSVPNYYGGTPPSPYKISYQGGEGANAIVVFTFSK